jgi:16S rRNA (cytosine1402-N4)-methyltransferase
MSGAVHIPVLCDEVVGALNIASGKTFIDGTFGAGGYTAAILKEVDCRIIAIDRDPDAIKRGAALKERFGDRLTLLEGRFGDMEVLVREAGFETVDGIGLDIGVSSPQIDEASRGFSFREDGPLDMRMEQTGRSAADVVNNETEENLANLIYRLGEERLSRRVAKAIVLARTDSAILRTSQLAEIVRGVVPRPRNKGREGIDPATRTFQALRIYVNDELGELGRGLEAAERLLKPGGRLAVVSFHSLEDRRVKTFIRSRAGKTARPSRHIPETGQTGPTPSFIEITRKPITPGAEEEKKNPRARSARLRVAERTDAPAWDREAA